MNDSRLGNFEQCVARIVAPLLARASRKQVIREELLSHLWEAYQEEMERLGDAAAAADATLRRMGSAEELSLRLQASVPILEMLICFCFARKELLMSRSFWILLGCLAAFFGTGLVLPALAQLKHSGSLPAGAVGALATGVAIATVGLCVLAYGISRLLRPAKV